MVRPVILSLLLHASVTHGMIDQLVVAAVRSLTNRVAAHGKPSDLQLQFPPQLTGVWRDYEELGMGSFGAVWKATAKTGACRECVVGNEYAIKLFYRKEGENRGIALTWANASSDEKKELDGAREECMLSKKIANISGLNDERRKYIMTCVEDRVGHSHENPDDVLFLVLGMGGTGMGTYWKKHGSKRSVDDLKSIMHQSMEALAFLAAPGKPNGYVHHDLKSDNMVLRDNPAGGLDVMLIDFGATLKSDVASSLFPDSVSNTNAPPEWSEHAFHFLYPFAFDIFCMANVFIELLTGETLIDIYYRGSLANYTAPDRTPWCISKDIGEDSCVFWHSLDVWWEYIKGRGHLDNATIIHLVQHRNATAPTDVQRHFFDQLKSDQDFLNFLDVIGSMFSHAAESRPSAQKVLESAFLTGRGSKAVASQVTSDSWFFGKWF